MRTPIRPVPYEAIQWTRWLRRFRWLDALSAWLLGWGAALWLRPAGDPTALGVLMACVVALAAMIPPVRRHWRPISTTLAVALSWPLRPGDRAWHIGPDGVARLVLVTAPRWRSVVVAAVVQDSGEGSVVFRTRGLLVRAQDARR